MRLALAALVGLIACTLAACGGALSEGQSQFDKGRYPEANQTFVSLEAESRGWEDARRARYDLYRGLTYAALGDLPQAGVWLREAKAIEDTHPGSLSHADLQRLRVAIDAND